MLELFPGVGNFLSLNLFLVRPETYVNRNFVQRFWKRRAKIVAVEAGCYIECRIYVYDPVKKRIKEGRGNQLHTPAHIFTLSSFSLTGLLRTVF